MQDSHHQQVNDLKMLHIYNVMTTFGGLQPHPGNGRPSLPNGQGASNPGTPWSPLSPLSPFLPRFPNGPLNHTEVIQTAFGLTVN